MSEAVVEVDIFSGSQNPRWPIPMDQAIGLYNQAIQFPDSDEKELFEGLGYRGFIVIIDQSPNKRITCYVLSDMVKIVTGTIAHYKKDDACKIETALLRTAKSQLNGSLYELIEKEIAIRNKCNNGAD